MPADDSKRTFGLQFYRTTLLFVCFLSIAAIFIYSFGLPEKKFSFMKRYFETRTLHIFDRNDTSTFTTAGLLAENSIQSDSTLHHQTKPRLEVTSTIPAVRALSKIIKQNDTTLNKQSTPSLDYTFKPVNDAWMLSFRNVCIEENDKKERQIVIYGKHDITETVPWFPLVYRNTTMPSQREIIRDYPVYFIAVMYPTNVFHFMEHFVISVTELLSATNRLHGKDIYNEVIVRQMSHIRSKETDPWRLSPRIKGGLHTSRYVKEVMEMMSASQVGKPSKSIFTAPLNVCYDTAVVQRNCTTALLPVNKTIQYPRRKRMVKYLIKAFNLSEKECAATQADDGETGGVAWYQRENITADKENFKKRRKIRMTVLQRNGARRILNVDEILKLGKEIGFATSTVQFEGISVREQMKSMFCTDILVAAHGAGLIWANLLPKGGALIEIAWPQARWPHYFHPHFELHEFTVLPYNESVQNLVKPGQKRQSDPKHAKDLQTAINKYYPFTYSLQIYVDLQKMKEFLIRAKDIVLKTFR